MITISRAIELRKVIEKASESLSDEIALTAPELFKPWRTNTSYTTGDRIQYNLTLYKCVQSHTSQSDWTPDVTPALWTEVSLDEFPEWKQPIGAQDAYMKDDKVSHNGSHWISTVDSNVWEPGVYGWNQL